MREARSEKHIKFKTSMTPEEYKIYNKERNLKDRYKKDLNWLAIKLKEQNYICPVCEKPLGDKKDYDCVDHCHETGETRDIIHNSCNKLIGIIENYHKGTKIMLNADNYIRMHDDRIKNRPNAN